MFIHVLSKKEHKDPDQGFRTVEFEFSNCFKVFHVIVGVGGISAIERGEFHSRVAEIMIMIIFNSNGCL